MLWMYFRILLEFESICNQILYWALTAKKQQLYTIQIYTGTNSTFSLQLDLPISRYHTRGVEDIVSSLEHRPSQAGQGHLFLQNLMHVQNKHCSRTLLASLLGWLQLDNQMTWLLKPNIHFPPQNLLQPLFSFLFSFFTRSKVTKYMPMARKNMKIATFIALLHLCKAIMHSI